MNLFLQDYNKMQVILDDLSKLEYKTQNLEIFFKVIVIIFAIFQKLMSIKFSLKYDDNLY